MKKIYAIISMIAFTFTATACSITINTKETSLPDQLIQSETQEVVVQIPTTAIEALNPEETQLFNSLIGLSKNLLAPSSIRVAEIYDTKRVVSSILFRINAQNKIGGTATGWFFLNLQTGKVTAVTDSKELNRNTLSANYNVNAINRAIEEYFS